MRIIDTLVKERKTENLIFRTLNYWRLWILKENPQLDLLPPEIGSLYRRSLLVLRTQIDWRGGIIAANDSMSYDSIVILIPIFGQETVLL